MPEDGHPNAISTGDVLEDRTRQWHAIQQDLQGVRRDLSILEPRLPVWLATLLWTLFSTEFVNLFLAAALAIYTAGVNSDAPHWVAAGVAIIAAVLAFFKGIFKIPERRRLRSDMASWQDASNQVIEKARNEEERGPQPDHLYLFAAASPAAEQPPQQPALDELRADLERLKRTREALWVRMAYATA